LTGLGISLYFLLGKSRKDKELLKRRTSDAGDYGTSKKGSKGLERGFLYLWRRHP
jgi:hypothetical protein